MEESDGQRERPDFWVTFPEYSIRGGQPAPEEPTSYWVLLIIVIVLLVGVILFGIMLEYLMRR